MKKPMRRPFNPLSIGFFVILNLCRFSGDTFATEMNSFAPKCSPVPFDHAEVVGGFIDDTYVLLVTGKTIGLNASIFLKPVRYKEKPEYWKIDVIRCGDSPPMLPIFENEYSVSLWLKHNRGHSGIQVVGLNQSKKIPIPLVNEATLSFPVDRNWKAWEDRQSTNPSGPTVYVTGEVLTSNGGIVPALKPASRQGFNPKVLILELTLENIGNGTTDVNYRPVHFKKDAVQGQYTQVTIRWQDKPLKPKTLDVDIVQ